MNAQVCASLQMAAPLQAGGLGPADVEFLQDLYKKIKEDEKMRENIRKSGRGIEAVWILLAPLHLVFLSGQKACNTIADIGHALCAARACLLTG